MVSSEKAIAGGGRFQRPKGPFAPGPDPGGDCIAPLASPTTVRPPVVSTRQRNDGVSSNSFRGSLRLTQRHMFSSSPWITVSSQPTKAWTVSGDAATHSPLQGETNLEAGARTHDICSASMALCKRSLRNDADTARGNGQRCRSQVETLEQAGAEGRLYFRRPSSIALSDGPNNTARWARHRPQVPTAIV
jgi:hypothetical protein